MTKTRAVGKRSTSRLKKRNVYVLMYFGNPWSVHLTSRGAEEEVARAGKMIYGFLAEVKVVVREVLP